MLKNQQKFDEVIKVYPRILVENPNQKDADTDFDAALEQTNQLNQAIALIYRHSASPSRAAA